MSGPYPEGWPKRMAYELTDGPRLRSLINSKDKYGQEVVPFSDAERLREALKITHAAIVTTLGAQGEDQPTFGQLVSAESVARDALHYSEHGE